MAVVSMTGQCWGSRTHLHELLEGSALKGLALVCGSIARHGDVLPLGQGDLVSEEGWCGREVLGGMSRRRWGTILDGPT